MTPALEQAFVSIAQLSETEQEQLAEILLLGISQLKEKQKVEAQESCTQAESFLQRMAKIRESIPKEERQKLPRDFAKREALTYDKHFEQAGFIALLRE